MKFPVTQQQVRIYVDKQRTPWWEMATMHKILGKPDTYYFGMLDERSDSSEHLYIITQGTPIHAMNLIKLLEVIRRSESEHAAAFLDWTLNTVLPALRRDPDYN